MNNDLKKIRDILSEISCSGEQFDHVLIKEDDKLATLKTVRLNIDPKLKDWFAFSPNKILSKSSKSKKLVGISPLLTLKKSIKYKENELITHHNQTCDCVVFFLEGIQLKLIFIELKSSLKGSEQNATNQIRSTEQFIKYLLGLSSEFYQVNFKTSYHRIIFHNTPIRKTTTAKKNTKNQLLKIIQINEGGSVFLKQII